MQRWYRGADLHRCRCCICRCEEGRCRGGAEWQICSRGADVVQIVQRCGCTEVVQRRYKVQRRWDEVQRHRGEGLQKC